MAEQLISATIRLRTHVGVRTQTNTSVMMPCILMASPWQRLLIKHDHGVLHLTSRQPPNYYIKSQITPEAIIDVTKSVDFKQGHAPTPSLYFQMGQDI